MGTESTAPALDTLAIELTNRCNERCVHCYIPDKRKDDGAELSFERMCSLIDEFVEGGGENILFTGGEILLYKQLLDLLTYSKNKGLWISLFFNGVALSERYVKTFKELGIDDVQISLYSINPEIHDSITRLKGSCERTKKSITRLVDSGVPVRIACSVIKDNMNHLCELLDYTQSLNINLGLEFNLIAREDRSNDNLDYRLSPEDLEHCFKLLARHNPEFAKRILRRIDRSSKETQEASDVLNEPVCGAARDMLYITSDGHYAICPGWIVNSDGIDSGISLKEFWESNEFLNEIRGKTEGSFPECLECEALDYCARCYARNYLETGDYTTPPEYACQYAFIAKKVAESEHL